MSDLDDPLYAKYLNEAGFLEAFSSHDLFSINRQQLSDLITPIWMSGGVVFENITIRERIVLLKKWVSLADSYSLGLLGYVMHSAIPNGFDEEKEDLYVQMRSKIKGAEDLENLEDAYKSYKEELRGRS